MDDGGVSKPVAVVACAAMALFYVAILYAPTLILRLPPPPSFKSFMIRRFICAAVSSVVSVLVSALFLPVKSREASSLLGVYGIRMDHIWQVVIFPLTLTALMYGGSLVLKSLLLMTALREYMNFGGGLSFDNIKSLSQETVARLRSIASDVLVWRTYVVAPVTEELVFRACMITSVRRIPKVHSHLSQPHFLQLGTFKPSNGHLPQAKLQLDQSPPGYRSPAWLYRGLWLLCIFSLHSNWTFSCSFSCSRILQFYGIACASFTGKRDNKCGICSCNCGFPVASFSNDSPRVV